MWFSQESNLAPHIKKGTRWHFFFLAFGRDKIHAQTLCSGQRNYQDKFTVDLANLRLVFMRLSCY